VAEEPLGRASREGGSGQIGVDDGRNPSLLVADEVSTTSAGRLSDGKLLFSIPAPVARRIGETNVPRAGFPQQCATSRRPGR
jgi:hypothetical protein